MGFTYPDKFTYLNTFVIQWHKSVQIMEVILYQICFKYKQN